jgi:hypothetical protein
MKLLAWTQIFGWTINLLIISGCGSSVTGPALRGSLGSGVIRSSARPEKKKKTDSVTPPPPQEVEFTQDLPPKAWRSEGSGRTAPVEKKPPPPKPPQKQSSWNG